VVDLRDGNLVGSKEDASVVAERLCGGNRDSCIGFSFAVDRSGSICPIGEVRNKVGWGVRASGDVRVSLSSANELFGMDSPALTLVCVLSFLLEIAGIFPDWPLE
jgi:hypothetical protein